MNLYNKYRPTDFDEMTGDSVIIDNLRTVITQEGRPHSFLFTGPFGCGKTSAALICADKYIEDSHVMEINAANNRGIDTAREIGEQIRGRPIAGNNWVYIIDEVHKTTAEFQNAMLKILEKPPEYVYFFLCTTNPEKLLKTLKSRCSVFHFSEIDKNRLFRLLRRVSRKEDRDIDKDVLEEITRECEGSARNALVLLEKVLHVEDKDQALRIVCEGIEKESKEIFKLCGLLLNGGSWKDIAAILKDVENKDIESIRYMILGYMSKVLLNRGDKKTAIIMESFLDPFYEFKKAGLIYACYHATNI